MRAHGRLRGRHQGSESRWEAIRALSSRLFCPCDSRRVSLGYLSAGLRYTTGRRVNTLCQGEAGLRDQVTLFQVYHNFVVPHVSLRQPLLIPEATNGCGSAKLWRPCTPAMAAGLTDHVWSLKEVLFYRVPPWPQP